MKTLTRARRLSGLGLTVAAAAVPGLAGVVAIATTAAAAPSWPSWRGPGADGGGPDGNYPVRWGPDENLAWKVRLPGKGCSTPIVEGGQILLTSPDDEGHDALIAFGLDGAQRWATTVGDGRRGRHNNGSSSNPSAVTDGKFVFAYFKSGNLAGLTLAGKLLWSTNLQERFGPDTLYWDIGTSPVLTARHVVVAVMHQGESFLAAFAKETGELAWKQARNYECPVEGDHSYATPLRIEHAGEEALLVWGAEHLTAHRASDGGLLWECGGFNPQRKKNWVAVASAVVAGGTAVVPYGRGSRLAGVRLGGSGDVTATHRTWIRHDTGSFVPTPAATGGKVYLVRDKGEVVCLDPATGTTLWEDRLPRSSAKYYASPTLAGGNLYAAREDGTVMVAKVEPAFAFLAENPMGEQIIASPVPLDGRLLLRGERHLFCVAAPRD